MHGASAHNADPALATTTEVSLVVAEFMEMERKTVALHTVQSESAEEKPPAEEIEEGYGEGSRSIILNVLKQVACGSDLHRVTLPSFILEPRSLLERLTDFMIHPHSVLHAFTMEDPESRFLSVLEYYLSGWHARPSGLKKPFNPVIGEYFRCSWPGPASSTNSTSTDDSCFPEHWAKQLEACQLCCSSSSELPSTYFFAEQVSHHPPLSVYHYECPSHHLEITGTFRPKSRLVKLNVVSNLGGSSTLSIGLASGARESYHLTYPNIYIRGLLFGKLMTELGDKITLECPSSGLSAEIEFKVKGFFTGSLNQVEGRVFKRATKEVLYKISGDWTSDIHIHSTSSPSFSYSIEIERLPRCRPVVPSSPGSMESRRLWNRVAQALLLKDYSLATVEKTLIEEAQREFISSSASSSTKFKFFKKQDHQDKGWCEWQFSGGLPDGKKDAEERANQLASLLETNFDADGFEMYSEIER